MFDSGYPLRFLIYNGDADMACQFMGDQWFIERFVANNKMPVTSPRQIWNYTRSTDFLPRVGGFAKTFAKSKMSIDLLTVRGAGHMVPTDRPGPGYQMIANFIQSINYTKLVTLDLTPQPLLPQYQPTPQKSWTRKQADRIWTLPGLTYNLNFKQYSGYLKGIDGNYLHYWFLESQGNPTTDPLVLWLNGGPGCSSLGGLLTELGPFHPNPDGKTLYENVYSWNKVANMLFLEGPRNVGFSVQNVSINPDSTYNDEKTAQDNYLALKDFLTIFPEFVNRPFYVTGESYGGVYVPTLTSLLIDKIQSGELQGLNLVGMAVGNGELSAIQQINSAIHLLYFHGLYGKKEWDSLLQCCDSSSNDPTWFEYCDFTKHIYIDSAGNAFPKDNNSYCGPLVAQLGQWRVWNTINDVYNIYQDCYQQTSIVFGSRNLNKHKEKIRAHLEQLFIDQGAKISTYSTDNQGGFPCFASAAAANYLNSNDVRNALHISPMAGDWADCNDTINAIYLQQHNDTGAVFDHIVKSRYPLRMLIYNGDVDQACNFLGDQWFVDSLAKRQDMKVAKKRKEWRYMNQIAGYNKQYSYGQGTIDVLTVKGAGHLVPTDRPGPALQMFANFLRAQDYSNNLIYTSNLSPLTDDFRIAERVAFASNYIPMPQSKAKGPSVSEHYGKAQRNLKKERNLNESTKKRTTFASLPPPPPGNKTTDAIDLSKLPGLTFTPNFKMYSGYLKASPGNNLFYWFVESQTNPTTDPLVLWLNGGPGCSSLGGFFQELGPLRNNPDGTTIFENIYAWNKYANVLFMEAPRGVGFSYRSNDVPEDNNYNDQYTASDNVLGLASFFQRFPEYNGRDFYITGESYGGVYIPTLTDALIKKIQDKTYPNIKLAGIGIGNGELSEIQQINSAISLTYFKGLHDKDDFDSLKPCCQNLGATPMSYCNFMQYVTLDTSGNAWPTKNDNSTAAMCGNAIVQQGFLDIWTTDNDVYNTYQDCYSTSSDINTLFDVKKARKASSFERRRAKRAAIQPLSNAKLFVDQAKQVNYASTDAGQGFTCYNGDAADQYLNNPDVRKALHIVENFGRWDGCNYDMNANYVQQHNDTTAVFDSILASKYPLNILIYNGDADMACQFLGDEWFIEALAEKYKMVSTARNSWNYTTPGNNSFLPQIGGYFKTFTYSPQVKIDLLTVKGGGHFVPTDRPGPALQMLYNFMNKRDYSKSVPDTITRLPLLPQYQPNLPKVPQRLADRIFSLPGLTYVPNFAQHSGYLNVNNGNYLHYWFVESQGDPSVDPIILWLNGGPGCSSLGGLFTELGPFRPNPDGQTLFENVYSWNKAASILFLESPRQVGFSYQDHSVSNDTLWNDEKTANDNVAAIVEFFKQYPPFGDYMNEFYVAGESYGGVYVPTLTAKLIEKIQSKELNLNLKGMLVGNGMISTLQDIRSLPDFMYFHGMYDKSDWDNLRACCLKYYPQSNYAQCDYTNFVYVGNDGGVYARNFTDPDQQACANQVEQLAYDRTWNIINNDVYNLYQDCYTQTTPVFGSAMDSSRHFSFEEIIAQYKMGPKIHVQAAITDFLSQLDPISTDSQGSFQCYMTAALTKYLNQSHVRDTMNIPDFVQEWSFCTNNPDFNYVLQYNDTGSVFKKIVDSGYPMRILVYNGDLDTACSMFEAEYFLEDLAQTNQFTTAYNRQEWNYNLGDNYAQSIAGYTKRFQKGQTTIDLLTVKGAGHFVPTDRPGPALQMLYNFLQNDQTYNKRVPYDMSRQPLLPQFTEGGNGEAFTTTLNPSSTTTSTSSTTTTTTTTATPKTNPTTQGGKSSSSLHHLFSIFVALLLLVKPYLF
ncbi:unnamed protein product, partial [Mesorhabditis belari]|uniref:Carboxypeptidase n=1 Tax=Mesorhabditis belari TaxID=2138241 RepID=A0AAF3F2M4_9BILA